MLLLGSVASATTAAVQDATAASPLQVLLVAVGAMASALLLVLRREDRRAKADETRADGRDKLLGNQVEELARQTKLLEQVVAQQSDLHDQQRKSDENRFHATKAIGDKIDALPERIEHRLRSPKDKP